MGDDWLVFSSAGTLSTASTINYSIKLNAPITQIKMTFTISPSPSEADLAASPLLRTYQAF